MSPDINIGDIFDKPELGRRLLILGAPGSGKTTMMLELAKNLLARSLNYSDQPIPVILNLASWRDPNSEIFDWIISEINLKYHVAPSLAKDWVCENQILILLDGLDEVIPQKQQECALAINRWLSTDLSQEAAGIVICCRDLEYETIIQANQNTRLALHGAIFIRPLTELQIQDYLKLFRLEKLWIEIQSNNSILELLTKPLFLSMFGLIQKYDPESLLEKFSGDSNKIDSLFSIYIGAMFKRSLMIDPFNSSRSRIYAEEAIPEPYYILKVLRYSSRILDQESRNGIDILIEELQPSILSRKQKIEYRVLVSLLMSVPPSLIFGLVIGVFAYFEPSFSGESIISKMIIFPVGLCLGLILTLFIFPVILLAFSLPGKLDRIEPIEMISLSLKDYNLRFKRIFVRISREIFNTGIWSILVSFISCSIFGVIGGFLLSFKTNLPGGITTGIFAGLLLGMIFGLVFGVLIVCTFGVVRGFMKGLIDGLKESIEVKVKPNQAIKNSLVNSRIVAACLFSFSILLYLPLVWLLKYNNWDVKSISGTLWLAFTLLIWSGFHESGGKAFLQHVALRIVLAHHKLIPRRYDLVLDYATERLMLQRVGGRYRFIHRLLQEYFADSNH